MKKRILTLLQYIVFLGGGLFLVWWQLKSMSAIETAEFYNAIQNANYWIIIPIVLMSLLSHVSRAMRWKLLMQPLGYRPKLQNLFGVIMIGYLANAAIPRLGEVLRCTFLAKYEKLKVDKLVGTIIIERSFDLLCFAIFIGITVLIQINTIGGFVESKFANTNFNSLEFAWKIALFFSFVVLLVFVIKKNIKRQSNNKFIAGAIRFLSGIGEGFGTIKTLQNKKAFLMHTLFMWCMYLGQIYLGFFGMDGIAGLSIQAACSVLALATLSMIVTPGGIGSFPIFVMQTLIIYGIDAPLGKAFGWMMWGVSTSLIILVGCISLIAMPYLNKKNNEINTTDTP